MCIENFAVVQVMGNVFTKVEDNVDSESLMEKVNLPRCLRMLTQFFVADPMTRWLC